MDYNRISERDRIPKYNKGAADGGRAQRPRAFLRQLDFEIH